MQTLTQQNSPDMRWKTKGEGRVILNNNNNNNNNLLFVYRYVIVNPLAPQIAVLIEAGQEVHTLNYI